MTTNERRLTEQLRDNMLLLEALKKGFGDSDLDPWWRKAIRDSKKLLKEFR